MDFAAIMKADKPYTPKDGSPPPAPAQASEDKDAPKDKAKDKNAKPEGKEKETPEINMAAFGTAPGQAVLNSGQQDVLVHTTPGETPVPAKKSGYFDPLRGPNFVTSVVAPLRFAVKKANPEGINQYSTTHAYHKDRAESASAKAKDATAHAAGKNSRVAHRAAAAINNAAADAHRFAGYAARNEGKDSVASEHHTQAAAHLWTANDHTKRSIS